MHVVSPCCGGEFCGICYRAGKGKVDATHKVGEEQLPGEPEEIRHNWTQYVCCQHFQEIFGLGPECWPELMAPREKFQRAGLV